MAQKIKETFQTNLFIDSLMRKIQDFREEKKFCDVTLISKNGDFKIDAHKMVISAGSEYFQAMFCNPLEESFKKDVNLHVDGESLKSIIDYIYSASIELTTDTVEDIFKAAHLFEIISLKTLCSNFMAKQLDPSNCLGIYLLAEQFSLEDLYAISEKFVCDNFVQLCDQDEFFNLNVNQLCKILSNNSLRVFSEEDVYRSLQSWVDHDRLEREKFLEKLIPHVRFQHLTPEFIADEMEEMCKTAVCREFILQAYKWHSLPEHRQLKYAEQQVPRKIRTKDMLVAISGWKRNDSTLNVGLYYEESSKWIYKSWPGLPVGLCKFGSTKFKNKLVIAGGIITATQTVSDRVRCLDLDTLKWSSLGSLIKPRHSFQMAEVNGCIYAVGGLNGDNRINTIEKWDPNSNRWEGHQSSKDFKIGFFHVCASLNSLHLCFRGDDSRYSIYEYNTSGKILCRKDIYSCENLFGIGIKSNGKLLHIFKTSTIDCSEDPFVRSAFDQAINEECSKCIIHNDKIIAYGTNIFQKYEYDEDANKWKMKPMPRLENTEEDVILVPVS